MLADVLDGNVPAGDRAVFEQHTGDCTACAQLLIEAQRGREWMKFLDQEPESPPDLVDKILLRTQGPLGAGLGAGMDAGFVQGGAMVLPGAAQMPPVLLPRATPMMLERAFHDARLLMTAAMAFFVIALTLSLLGFRLDTVKAAELKPQTLEANVTRQFYGTKKQVVSFYDNLRVVYEVESKMKELRGDEEPEARPRLSPEAKPQVNPEAKPSLGPEAKPKAKSEEQPGKLPAPAGVPRSAPETSREEPMRGMPAVAWQLPTIRTSNQDISKNERSRA
jgi:hypothetical protein